MLIATAVVVTDKPERYAKQLLSHVGRKNVVDTPPDAPGGGRITFPDGAGTMRPQEGRLVLEAVADDAAGLAHVTDVLGRHLERFGAREGLSVVWETA